MKPGRSEKASLNVISSSTALRREAEEAARMVTVVRDSNDAITIQDFEGRITAWNHGAELMYGYSEIEALAMNIERLTAPGKVDEQKDFVRRLIAGEAVTSLETQRVTKDGRILDVWMTVTKLVDKAGKPIGIASTERDITARNREKESLRRMATVVSDSNDAITIQDFEGRITAWNRGAGLMYGYSEEEALAMNIERLTAPGKVDEQKDSVRRLIAGEAITSFETQRVTKDGRILDVWMTVTKLVDKAGKPIGIASTERDITERRRAGEESRSASLYARSLIEASLDPLVTISPDGMIMDVNQATVEVTGVGRERLIGNDFATYFTEPERARSGYRQVLADGLVRDYPLTIRHASGKTMDVLYNAAVYRDEAGEVQGVFAAARDITDLRRAEDAKDRIAADLKRSNKDLEQFAYVASHDLQEPLRMVSSYVQLLAHRYEAQLDDKARKYIDCAVDGAVRMQQLIEGLLLYSRAGTRGGPLEPTDSGAALAAAARNLAKAVEQEKAVITHDDLPVVRADASQLAQVFQNLLSNAVKFHGEEPPRVHVSAEDKGSEWVLSVRDNGIGIDPQYADRVFVIFQRLHTRQEYAGTGIGLAVCQRIVERHGGRIWFESEPGVGSTFHFTIPK